MQVYLDSYGAFLGVRNGLFWIKPRQAEGRSIPVRKVKAIFLAKGVRVSTDALQLAIQEGIPVLLLDGIGRPLGQVWSGQFGSISTIRKQQALFSLRLEGLYYMAKVLRKRLYGQEQVLTQLMTQGRIREQQWHECKLGLEAMNKQFRQAHKYKNINDLKNSMRGWEGVATRQYFRLLSKALPKQYRFEQRVRRPAYDPFNALLNYLYGMLYPTVELSLMKAGLDPYAGILHADEYNRPTLVYDFIEMYRHWAEWTAVSLCIEEQLPSDAFINKDKEGFWLAKPGKNIVIGTFLKYLDEKEIYQGKQRRRSFHIDMDAIQLATKLRDSQFEI
ncbi:MAG: CRISPR-associated endonuclease Cas1 [Chitinophagales bacterium]|nr:CRISPR-associated endonuclease Cas1 [Chitinophagales bacterium]